MKQYLRRKSWIQTFLCLLFVLLSSNCKQPELENQCDPQFSGYYETILIKILSGSATNHCGMNLLLAPIFFPAPGHYTEPQYISISTFTPGATIYFTTDGSVPTAASTPYSSPAPIWRLAGQRIRAIAIKPGMDNSPISEGTYSLLPLKTGQTTSYASGDDFSIGSGISTNYTGPSASTTYPNDYTTFDQSTGILWKSCSQGLEGPTCAINSPGLTAGNNTTLVASCTALNSLNSGHGYAGHTNWRLSTMKELLTTNDAGKASTTIINSSALPGTVAFAYWVSTPYLVNVTNSWYLDYQYGDSYVQNTNVYHGRCVASPAPIETLSYTDNGDGTVKDNATGLTWQKCSYGQNNDSTCSLGAGNTNWTTALTYCSGLNLGSRTWRLPNRNELVSLYDFTKSAPPMIEQSVFPNTSSNHYWTSTTHGNTIGNAWYVNFGTSTTNLYEGIPKSTNLYVRCVSN